jgi:hypothetical protein
MFVTVTSILQLRRLSQLDNVPEQARRLTAIHANLYLPYFVLHLLSAV